MVGLKNESSVSELKQSARSPSQADMRVAYIRHLALSLQWIVQEVKLLEGGLPKLAHQDYWGRLQDDV